MGLALAATVAPSPARAESLTHRLRHHPSYKVRLQAAIYLAKRRDPKSLSALLHCAERERHYLVQAFCAVGLGRLGNRRALPVLKKLARRGHRFVRKRARRAIELIEIQSPKGTEQGYPMQFKPRAKVFVLVEKPPKRPRRVPASLQRLARKSLRLLLNRVTEIEVARPGVRVPGSWLKKRRLPALAVELRVTRVRRQRTGRRVTVSTQVRAVITKYPSQSVAAIAETESASIQEIQGRVRRRELRRLYRMLERRAIESALNRVTQRIRQVPAG